MPRPGRRLKHRLLTSGGVLEILKEENLTAKVNQFVDSIAYLWKDEPLDGDQTAKIANMVLAELDRRNGNN
jgi:hypothetical protein